MGAVVALRPRAGWHSGCKPASCASSARRYSTQRVVGVREQLRPPPLRRFLQPPFDGRRQRCVRWRAVLPSRCCTAGDPTAPAARRRNAMIAALAAKAQDYPRSPKRGPPPNGTGGKPLGGSHGVGQRQFRAPGRLRPASAQRARRCLGAKAGSPRCTKFGLITATIWVAPAARGLLDVVSGAHCERGYFRDNPVNSHQNDHSFVKSLKIWI
jgi:hypothetical protein